MSYIFDDNSFALRNLSYLTKNYNELQGFFARAFGIMWLSVFHYERCLVTKRRMHRRYGRIFHRKVHHWAITGTNMLHGSDRFLDAMANLCVLNSSPEDLVLSFQDAASACAAGQCRLLQALAYERLSKALYLLEPEGRHRRIHSNQAFDLYRKLGSHQQSK